MDAETKQSRYAVSARTVHLNCGWRWLAWVRDGMDAETLAAGLDLNGYDTEAAALAAVAKAEGRDS